MDLPLIILAFLVLSLVVTYLIKRFARQQTYYLISLIRTKKPLPLFDKLAGLGRVLDIFADIGLVLGFGSIAVDYLYLRKYRKLVRIPLFVLSVIAISGFFVVIDLLLNGMFSSSPFMRDYFYIVALIFGLTGFAGFVIMALVAQAYDIIAKYLVGTRACPGVAPVIPGVELPNVPIVVPWHGWISFLIILVIHEGMHGILARRNKLKIKSTGLLLLGFLPIGAFVEPDEKEVAAAEPRKAIRLFSAGPTANLFAMVLIQIFVIAFSLMLLVFVYPWAMPIKLSAVGGVSIASVDQNLEWCGTQYDSPAFGVFEEGMIIKQINDRNILSISDVQAEKMAHLYEPMTFLLEKDGELSEKTIAPNDMGMFGFTMEEFPNEDYTVPGWYRIFSIVLSEFSSFIAWLFILNFLIAIVNFLPMMPFDGGRIAKIMLLPYFSFLGLPKEDTEKLIAKVFFFIILALLAVNALPLFI